MRHLYPEVDGGGLDQEFNSLDAQREACAAYAQSQRQEGWVLLPGRYDDGGYSGGNMDRPGLQRLLADVRSGKVDVIIVYKVDRLTRSLTDFAKIVEALDGAGASFVSITQSFNATTSMGRLTLNVLLSFGQFEREVISERVRDKIAASKARGIWMGGTVPLGYEAVGRKLVINEAEAETVRFIMRRYLEMRSVRGLMDDLKRRGVRTKVQRVRDGSTRGGISFVKGPLYYLLKNSIYIGQIVHHDQVYLGQHEAIIARELFDQVQALLASNASLRASGASSSHPSLLAGMIRDADDRPMSPSHTCKGGRRYRYYASNVAVPGDQNSLSVRIPAAELERGVREAVACMLERADAVRQRLSGLPAAELKRAFGAMHQLAQHMRDEPVFSCQELLRKLGLQLTIDGQGITASCSVTRLAREIGLSFGSQDERLPVLISTRISVRGRELRLVIMPLGTRPPKLNRHLINLIVQAHRARDELMEMGTATGDDGRRRDLTRLAKCSYLAPDIISAILDGRQPDDLGARKLKRISELPLPWEEQRKVLGFA